MRAIVIVLDSVGIGEAPDASDFGDEGSATLPHTAASAGGLNLPVMEAMGLGNIPGLLPKGKPIDGVSACPEPIAAYGAMRELSEGKDTITGHWELAGLLLKPGFHLFPPETPSFPEELLQALQTATGRGIIGNRAASGTAIMNELGPQHMESGSLICYTSADSVFQICAHEDIVPVDELYRICETARKLCDPYRVGRVIARPFVGSPGDFTRTENRRDFAFQPDEPTLLERVYNAGMPVYAVGKIEDIYAHRGITESVHSGNNLDSQAALIQFVNKKDPGLIFANFIDFDMLYGHRRDPAGYAACLEQADRFLAELLPNLQEDDLLIITADHGNDPTFNGTDHTREFVPVLLYGPGCSGKNLGVREGFFDLSQTVLHYLNLEPGPRGTSMLS